MAAYRMGRAAGSIIIVEPDRPPIERDTLQCVHCGGHWSLAPGSGKQRGWCTRCNGPHCGRAKCWECRPLMRRIEEQEQRQQFFAALGLAT